MNVPGEWGQWRVRMNHLGDFTAEYVSTHFDQPNNPVWLMKCDLYRDVHTARAEAIMGAREALEKHKRNTFNVVDSGILT